MCREAAARAQRSGSPMARAAAYWNASSIAGERGDTHRAVELASRALTLLGEGEDARNLARLRGELGLLMVADGESSVREAASLLRRARQDLRRAGASQVDEARCDLGLARCALLEQDLDAAERHALAARPKATAVPVAHADADVVLGRVAAARGDVAQALECYRAATRTLTGVMADRAVAQAWYELGALLDEAGDAAGARDAYRSAAAASGLQPTRDARPLFSSLASR
jgi:tetratricopeptide (TPR) repeat protein